MERGDSVNNNTMIMVGHDIPHTYSPIYVGCFFFMGLTWFFPGSKIIQWIHNGVLLSLVVFYVIHHNIFQKGTVLINSFICFFIAMTLFFLHSALTNLYELTRLGYIPFHDVYRALGIKSIVRVSLHCVFAYVLFRCCQEDRNGLIFRAFAWGTIVLFVFFVVFFLNQFSVGERLMLVADDNESIAHPNRLAVMFLLFFYINLLAYSYSRCLWSKLCHGLFCLAAVGAIILTQSRTSLVALLLGLLFGLSFQWRRLLWIFLLTLLMGTMYWVGDIRLSDYLPARFTIAQAVRDKASGRSEVWGDYLKHATLEDWLLGRGYFAHQEAILYQKPLAAADTYLWAKKKTWGLILGMHSVYLESVLVFGLFGGILYCCWAFILLKRMVNNVLYGKANWMYLSMWVSFLLWSISESDFLNKSFLFFWAIALSQVCKKDGDESYEA